MMSVKNKKSISMGTTVWTTYSILEATGGSLREGDMGLSFSGISIDSRSIKTDELFIAIKGDVYDGHDFINDAIDNCILLVKSKIADPNRLVGEKLYILPYRKKRKRI